MNRTLINLAQRVFTMNAKNLLITFVVIAIGLVQCPNCGATVQTEQ